MTLATQVVFSEVTDLVVLLATSPLTARLRLATRLHRCTAARTVRPNSDSHGAARLSAPCAASSTAMSSTPGTGSCRCSSPLNAHHGCPHPQGDGKIRVHRIKKSCVRRFACVALSRWPAWLQPLRWRPCPGGRRGFGFGGGGGPAHPTSCCWCLDQVRVRGCVHEHPVCRM